MPPHKCIDSQKFGIGVTFSWLYSESLSVAAYHKYSNNTARNSVDFDSLDSFGCCADFI